MKMKRILFAIISLSLLITGITTLSGCSGGRSRGGQARIRVFQTSGSGGIVRVMPKLIVNSNIAYADNMELGADESYILYTSNITNGIRAYVEDENGIRKSDVVTVAPDYTSEGMAECINITYQLDNANGGVDFGIQWASPGKCKIVLTGGGMTREINVLAWGSQKNVGVLGAGIAITEAGHTPVILENSDIYEQTSEYYLSGDWYLVDTCSSTDWMQKFKAVTTVDTSFLTAGPHAMKIGDIYISRAKNGGFIKSVRLMWTDLVYDWCDSDGQFRDF